MACEDPKLQTIRDLGALMGDAPGAYSYAERLLEAVRAGELRLAKVARPSGGLDAPVERHEFARFMFLYATREERYGPAARHAERWVQRGQNGPL